MSGEHILVVEDDEVLRSGICDLLELSGYAVSAARDGVHAIDILQSLGMAPALIVSDIRMPNMDGYEFLEAVRERPEWLSIPFIFLSAKGDREDIRRGKLRGADDYISKPFDFQDLVVAIQSSLSRHEELHALQEARLNTLKRRILDVINHEFRTPLTYIVAYADLMAKEESFQHSKDLRQYINGILEGSERLSRLIENFLVLAELESDLGEKIYERRQSLITDFGQLVREVVDGFEARAAKKNVSVDLQIEDPLPPIKGDYPYLEISIRELIDNAVRFSPEGETVAVTVMTGGNYDDKVLIVVNDHGPGISAEKQADLFDIFYQVDRERLEQGGAGAGLAIIQRVARLHKGNIGVESAPGQGSRFILRLPAAGAA
jgi:two-component system sensor histidine kinase/response regulator